MIPAWILAMFLSHIGGVPGLFNQATALTAAALKAPAVKTTVKTAPTVIPPTPPKQLDKKTSTTPPPPPPPVKPPPDKVKKSKMDGDDHDHGKGNG